MTLTYPMLDRARRVLWVVTGGEKAAMLARLRDGDRRASRPGACGRTTRWCSPIVPRRGRRWTG